MAGISAFNYKNRTLLINYNYYTNYDDDDVVDADNAPFYHKLLSAPPQIFQHNSKSLILWRVFVRSERGRTQILCIEPVFADINKNFAYEFSVVVNGSKIAGVGPSIATQYECRVPVCFVGSIQIRIIYPHEAINQIAHTPVTHLPKMLTHTSSRDKFADVQFIVEEKVIEAHKVILADRSEVFNKMFMWNADNATNNKPIPITDFSYDGFYHFINAIYFGLTPADPKVCLEMVSLAEKYHVQDIKTEVEKSIIASINMENAISILINAYLNNAERMKKAALEFCVKSPMHEMNGSKELAKFPDLLNEVFKQFSLLSKKL